jgi:hypothetical protein
MSTGRIPTATQQRRITRGREEGSRPAVFPRSGKPSGDRRQYIALPAKFCCGDPDSRPLDRGRICPARRVQMEADPNTRPPIFCRRLSQDWQIDRNNPAKAGVVPIRSQSRRGPIRGPAQASRRVCLDAARKSACATRRGIAAQSSRASLAIPPGNGIDYLLAVTGSSQRNLCRKVSIRPKV